MASANHLVPPTGERSTFDGLLPGVDDHTPRAAPDTLADLRLDVVIEAVAGRGEEPGYLAEVARRPSREIDAIAFRQEIFADLQDGKVREVFERFTLDMRRIRGRLATVAKTADRNTREAGLLAAARAYCSAVRELHAGAAAVTTRIRSRGLGAFLAFVERYTEQAEFLRLEDDSAHARAALDSIDYCVHVHGLRVTVSRYQGEEDYSRQVASVFERFEQSEATSYLRSYRGWPALGHVGTGILQLVERLFPEIFEELHRHYDRHRDFFDPTVRRFEREVHFYLAYLAYIQPLRSAGLAFCLPRLDSTSKEERVTDTFDLALAAKLAGEGKPVVTNEYRLGGAERIIVVSGPNQGGKTTLARTFGQLHHLARLGCPVPGSDARLFLCDAVLTLFEREEQLSSMTGKLEDDLLRVKEIFASATPRSVVVMNEPFSSTSLADARLLGEKALTRMAQLDVLGLYVTFVDELTRLGPTLVSMVSTVEPQDPAQRTYKVVRAPADGLAYAMALAKRRNVTYEQLTRRLRP